MTHNQGLEIFNMSPVENGDRRFIRREYIETNNLDEEDVKAELPEEGVIDNAATSEQGIPSDPAIADIEQQEN